MLSKRLPENMEQSIYRFTLHNDKRKKEMATKLQTNNLNNNFREIR